jgi:hypothetical protein
MCSSSWKYAYLRHDADVVAEAVNYWIGPVAELKIHC